MEPLRKNATGFLLCKKLCKAIKNWGNCQRKKILWNVFLKRNEEKP